MYDDCQRNVICGLVSAQQSAESFGACPNAACCLESFSNGASRGPFYEVGRRRNASYFDVWLSVRLKSYPVHDLVNLFGFVTSLQKVSNDAHVAAFE